MVLYAHFFSTRIIICCPLTFCFNFLYVPWVISFHIRILLPPVGTKSQAFYPKSRSLETNPLGTSETPPNTNSPFSFLLLLFSSLSFLDSVLLLSHCREWHILLFLPTKHSVHACLGPSSEQCSRLCARLRHLRGSAPPAPHRVKSTLPASSKILPL